MLAVAYGLWLLLALTPLRAGDPAPAAIEIETLNEGRQVLDLPGRITIVDFFATWCPRCRESVDSYADLVRAYGDQLRIIVIDVEEDPATVQRFFARHPLPEGVPIGLDFTGKVFRSFGARGFPSFFVIDEKGVVRAAFSGWGEGSGAKLGEWVGYLLKKGDARATAAAPPPRGGRRRARMSPAASRAPVQSEDQRARNLGIEILR